ncbi:unnamed protein product [Prunus armeniaca]|uniref:Uncharacterized protein n=1 Tax=Prunus armeniaca TaxID=36596 RepID=A0A6J5USA5_PRUAR|nr:unnamed protein product [Prunus armeniaca]
MNGLRPRRTWQGLGRTRISRVEPLGLRQRGRHGATLWASKPVYESGPQELGFVEEKNLAPHSYIAYRSEGVSGSVWCASCRTCRSSGIAKKGIPALGCGHRHRDKISRDPSAYGLPFAKGVLKEFRSPPRSFLLNPCRSARPVRWQGQFGKGAHLDCGWGFRQGGWALGRLVVVKICSFSLVPIGKLIWKEPSMFGKIFEGKKFRSPPHPWLSCRSVLFKDYLREFSYALSTSWWEGDP